MTNETLLKMIRDFDVYEYVEDYEFRGDGDYTPNDHEKTLIEDAVMGAISSVEERIRAAIAASPPPPVEVSGEMVERAQTAMEIALGEIVGYLYENGTLLVIRDHSSGYGEIIWEARCSPESYPSQNKLMKAEIERIRWSRAIEAALSAIGAKDA